MALINFIKWFYIIYLIAIAIVVFYELKGAVCIKKRILFCVGSTLSILIINFFWKIKVLSCFLEFFIIFLLTYYMKFETLISTILISSLYALTVSLSRYILILTYSAMVYDLKVLNILNYKLVLSFCLFLVVILIGILYFIKSLIRDVIKKRVTSIAKYTKITMATGIIIFLSEMIFDNVKIDSNIVYKVFMISINIAFYLGITYVCLYKKCRDFNTKVKVNLLERQLDYQKNYYEEIIGNYDNARKALHDMNNHMSVIKYLLESNDYNGLGEYLEDFGAHIPSNRRNNICDNKVVNAICLEKLGICNDKNIDINFDISIPQIVDIEVVDLCTVFGNLLDNAIEACEKISNLSIKKIIRVESKVYLNQLHISVFNSKDNIIKKHTNRFITSKKDKKKHGIGLDNVKLAIENNNGYIDFIDSNNTFEVKLYLMFRNK